MRNRKSVMVFGLGVVVAAILLANMLTYQVKFTETAVVETFGQLASEPAEPGLHLRWPWPVQRVVKYDTRLHHFEDVYQELQTGDKKVLMTSVFVVWRIDSPILFRNSIGDRQGTGEQRLRELVSKSKQAVLGGTNMSDLVSLRRDDERLHRVEQAMLDEVRQQAMEQYGITVEAIRIKRMGLPEDVTATVLKTMRAERERIAQDAESRGKARAADITAEAKSVADQVMAFARGRAAAIRAQGDAEAARFYQLYGQHQGFAMFLRRMDFLREVLPKNTQFIFDGSILDRSLGYFRQAPTAADVERDGAVEATVTAAP